MNNRVKELRKSLGLTQNEFADKINMSRSNFGSIETGRVNLTDRVINDICKAFSVNKSWLTSGEGEMYEIIDSDEQFHRILGEWLVNCDQVTKDTVLSLNQLTREEFEFVSRMLKSLSQNK